MSDKIKINEELPIVFTPSGNFMNLTFPSGTTFINWDTAASTAQGLVHSDICDLGPAPRTNLFVWRSRVYFGTEKSADADVEFYISTTDGNHSDGLFGSGIPPPTNFNPANLKPLGTARCPGSSSFAQLSGMTRITDRYLNVLGYLPTASGNWNSGSYSYFMLTPVPPEVEDQ